MKDNILTVLVQGFIAGFSEPNAVSDGLSYDDDPNSPLSKAYNRGADIGSFVRQPFKKGSQ